MAYNSSAMNLTATTTDTIYNISTITSSILFKAPSSNTDYVLVRLGSGSPFILRAGEAIGFDIEEICSTIRNQGFEIPAQIFISSFSLDANSATQAVDVIIQEWREK